MSLSGLAGLATGLLQNWTVHFVIALATAGIARLLTQMTWEESGTIGVVVFAMSVLMHRIGGAIYRSTSFYRFPLLQPSIVEMKLELCRFVVQHHGETEGQSAKVDWYILTEKLRILKEKLRHAGIRYERTRNPDGHLDHEYFLWIMLLLHLELLAANRMSLEAKKVARLFAKFPSPPSPSGQGIHRPASIRRT